MTKANGSTQQGTPLLEWIAAGLGLALILALLSVIALEGLQGDPNETPAIELSLKGIASTGGGYVVTFEAFNRAGGTAQSVEVEGALSAGAVPVETSSVTLDFVPGHSRRGGGLFFRRDPRQGRLELRALGFQEP